MNTGTLGPRTHRKRLPIITWFHAPSSIDLVRRSMQLDIRLRPNSNQTLSTLEPWGLQVWR
jgi:hypothetical protein